MFGTHDLAIFIVSGLMLNILPGPDSLLVMTRSATQGWRAGSISAFGIGAGIFVHVFAAALGLSALLATSSNAFAVVKYMGAAYLLYIGIVLLRKEKKSAGAWRPLPPPMSYRRIFIQGFFTNVLNPKVALFFLAFVPQFIAAEAPSKPLAFVVLGCIFNVNGMLWCHLLAVSSAFASRRIQTSQVVLLWLNRFVGVVFVSLGVRLALTSQR